MFSKETRFSQPFEYKDGLAFCFNMPKEGWSLRAVSIENDAPKLHFTPAKKVPAITEEDVATCIRLSQDNKRPEFFYTKFLSGHPFARLGRWYKQYQPAYLRHTQVGKLLAEVDWQMKCLHVGVRSNENRNIFQSWPKTSNLDGLASQENFVRRRGGAQVMMTCKSVHVSRSTNELVFVGEPIMQIVDTGSAHYTKYLTDHFDSIAYHDEPLFLKLKEIIKLILAAEWLRDKGVQFSQVWIEEHTCTSDTQNPQKPLQVELPPDVTDFIMKFTQENMCEMFKLFEFAFSGLNLAIEEPKKECEECKQKTGIEFACRMVLSPPDVPPALQMVAHYVCKATINDFDFLYEGLDPNSPVALKIKDGKLTLLKPEVNSWAELFSETEPLPCKWLQDRTNPLRRSPIVTGGVSTASIPVQTAIVAGAAAAAVNATAITSAVTSTAASAIATVSAAATGVLNVTAAAAGLVQNVFKPDTSDTCEPPTDVHCDYQLDPSASDDQVETFSGFTDSTSEFGTSSESNTTQADLPIHWRVKTTVLAGGKEVQPPITLSMSVRVPLSQETEMDSLPEPACSESTSAPQNNAASNTNSSNKSIPAPSDSSSNKSIPAPSDSSSNKSISAPSDSFSNKSIPAPSNSSSNKSIPALSTPNDSLNKLTLASNGSSSNRSIPALSTSNGSSNNKSIPASNGSSNNSNPARTTPNDSTGNKSIASPHSPNYKSSQAPMSKESSSNKSVPALRPSTQRTDSDSSSELTPNHHPNSSSTGVSVRTSVETDVWSDSLRPYKRTTEVEHVPVAIKSH